MFQIAFIINQLTLKRSFEDGTVTLVSFVKSLGVSIKYRDGNPFAFLNREFNDNQWILYYSTIQAEDKKGIKGGPREDYVSDISLKLSYSFKLFRKNASLGFSFFNVLDFGSEISEYVFSGGERYSMELQIPKSIRLNLSFEL